jgi:hypothetical protein
MSAARAEVAHFAGYAVGSVMGDGDPAVDCEVEKVFHDDHAYQVWHKRMLDCEKQMRGSGSAECNGAPVSLQSKAVEAGTVE